MTHCTVARTRTSWSIILPPAALLVFSPSGGAVTLSVASGAGLGTLVIQSGGRRKGPHLGRPINDAQLGPDCTPISVSHRGVGGVRVSELFGKTQLEYQIVSGAIHIPLIGDLKRPINRRLRQHSLPLPAPTPAARVPHMRDLVRMVNECVTADSDLELSIENGLLVARIVVEYR